MGIQTKALRTAPALAAMGAMFFFATPQLRAEDHHDCREKIEHAQAKLNHEVAEHGRDDLRTRHARHELNEAREHCMNGQDGAYDNRSSDDGAYRDRRDQDQYDNNRQYSNTDNGQYRDNRQYTNPNDNPNYNDPNYNNPNYNNNSDNGQYQPPPDDQQPR